MIQTKRKKIKCLQDVHITVDKYKKITGLAPLLGFRLMAFVFPLLVPVSGDVR